MAKRALVGGSPPASKAATTPGASVEQSGLEPPSGSGLGRNRRPLEEAADPSVLYLHPVGKKQLRLYAGERGVKVHDLLLEAIEQWAADRGLAGPWRVPSSGHPRRTRS